MGYVQTHCTFVVPVHPGEPRLRSVKGGVVIVVVVKLRTFER